MKELTGCGMAISLLQPPLGLDYRAGLSDHNFTSYFVSLISTNQTAKLGKKKNQTKNHKNKFT